jgi:hypothetical protein
MPSKQFAGKKVERGAVLAAHGNVGPPVFFEVVEP